MPQCGIIRPHSAFEIRQAPYLRAVNDLRDLGGIDNLHRHRIGDGGSGGATLALELVHGIAARDLALPLVAAVQAEDIAEARDAGIGVARERKALVEAAALKGSRGAAKRREGNRDINEVNTRSLTWLTPRQQVCGVAK